MTLADVNQLDRETFIDTLAWVFEHSPWVAERSWPHRPFASLDALHQAMTHAVAAAAPEHQLALIRAHPDLGARAKMSCASVAEQAGAALDRLAPAEFEELQRLNSAYREKFGFPFIYAVKGSTKHDILAALEQRLAGDQADEHAAALAQIYRIARIRLEEILHA